jgi:hypothetical protein
LVDVVDVVDADGPDERGGNFVRYRRRPNVDDDLDTCAEAKRRQMRSERAAALDGCRGNIVLRIFLSGRTEGVIYRYWGGVRVIYRATGTPYSVLRSLKFYHPPFEYWDHRLDDGIQDSCTSNS